MDEMEIAPGKRSKLRISNILIILFLAGAGTFTYYRLSLKSKLQARIDAIRAAGYPVTCAELNQWYKIPPNVENAAYTIIDAFSFYKKWDKDKSKSLPVVGRAKLPARTEPMDEEMKALITQYVADNNEALELLHAGAAIEHSRYPINLNAGYATFLPNLSEIRNAAQLLELEALLHAENGNGAAALHSAIACIGIARSLEREPITVSQLVRGGCQNIAISTIEQIVNRVELTDEQLVELIEKIRNAERICDISCAYAGERCLGLSFFKSPGSTNPDIIEGIPVLNWPILMLYASVGMADTDMVIYLDLMEEYMKSTRLPLHERQRAVDAVSAKLQSASNAHILLHKIMPRLSKVTTIELRTIARLRTANAALAVQCYRLAENKLPYKLTDLVPTYLESIPKDPFDGEKLRYKRHESGFVIYSIGDDLSDDGGKEKPSRSTKESPKWDVTFIFER